jgi:hypothetical protein
MEGDPLAEADLRAEVLRQAHPTTAPPHGVTGG